MSISTRISKLDRNCTRTVPIFNIRYGPEISKKKKKKKKKKKAEKTRFLGTDTDTGTCIRILFTVPVPLIYAQKKTGTTNSVTDRYRTGTVLIPIGLYLCVLVIIYCIKCISVPLWHNLMRLFVSQKCSKYVFVNVFTSIK